MRRENGWRVYRHGDRLTEEADVMLSRMANRRVRGLLEMAQCTPATLMNLLESAYMQGFEDAGMAAINLVGHAPFCETLPVGSSD